MQRNEVSQYLRKEALGGGVYAVISPAHGFGTDALLLARFAAPGKRDIACDLCSGCGIIPLLWCRDGLARQITAVELQEQACAQLKMAVAQNALADKVTVVQADLRLAHECVPAGAYDLASVNPPYQAACSGPVSTEQTAAVARHECCCTLEEVCRAGVRLLRFGGRLAVCCRPQRLFSLMQAMQKAGAQPKRLVLVAKDAQSAPRLALVQARRGGKPGLLVEPMLFLYDAQGRQSAAARAWYGAYAHGDTEGTV